LTHGWVSPGFYFLFAYFNKKGKVEQNEVCNFEIELISFDKEEMHLKVTLITHCLHSACKADNVIHQFGNHSGIFVVNILKHFLNFRKSFSFGCLIPFFILQEICDHRDEGILEERDN
jgi:hypothetical protein